MQPAQRQRIDAEQRAAAHAPLERRALLLVVQQKEALQRRPLVALAEVDARAAERARRKEDLLEEHGALGRAQLQRPAAVARARAPAFASVLRSAAAASLAALVLATAASAAAAAAALVIVVVVVERGGEEALLLRRVGREAAAVLRPQPQPRPEQLRGREQPRARRADGEEAFGSTVLLLSKHRLDPQPGRVQPALERGARRRGRRAAAGLVGCGGFGRARGGSARARPGGGRGGLG